MTRPNPSRPRPARPLSTVLRTKAVLAAPCALALAAVTAGCGNATAGTAAVPLPSAFSPSPGTQVSTITSPADSQLRAYIKAHPVPDRPGMTAGIQSFNQPGGSLAYQVFPCPTGITHGSVGDPDACYAWKSVLVTATGTLTITCGSITLGIPCPSKAYPANSFSSPFPVDGDYLYAPSNGQVTAARDVRVIRREAIS